MTRIGTLLALALLSACGAQTAASTSPSPSPTSVADALGAKLVAAVPQGFVVQADSVGQTGPSDLAKAVRDDGGANAQAQLTTDGFVAGYQRLWKSTDGSIIVVYLYQFKTQAGATDYQPRAVQLVAINSPTATL